MKDKANPLAEEQFDYSYYKAIEIIRELLKERRRCKTGGKHDLRVARSTRICPNRENNYKRLRPNYPTKGRYL